MKKNETLGRRDAVRHLAVFAASAIAPAWILEGCKSGPKELSCADTTGLTPDEITMRTNLAYVDKATDTSKECVKCNFFKPAAPDACGACTLIKGPINPAGYCNSFVVKAV
ncbi:hypothetical protein BH09MYX1_BH09MYX1_12640 [soil metagenome]